ncbi:transcriptional regulator, partial [Roseibium hamelinense]
EVEYEDDEKIVLRNSRCPFGEKVKGRPSLCMMTTNVFGRITANNTGYAKVHIEQAIATGASGCRVVVYLSETAAGTEGGVEFFRTA